MFIYRYQRFPYDIILFYTSNNIRSVYYCYRTLRILPQGYARYA